MQQDVESINWLLLQERKQTQKTTGQFASSFNGNIARTDLENRNILISSPLSEESVIKLSHDLKTGANQGCGCEVLEE